MLATGRLTSGAGNSIIGISGTTELSSFCPGTTCPGTTCLERGTQTGSAPGVLLYWNDGPGVHHSRDGLDARLVRHGLLLVMVMGRPYLGLSPLLTPPHNRRRPVRSLNPSQPSKTTPVRRVPGRCHAGRLLRHHMSLNWERARHWTSLQSMDDLSFQHR